MTPVSMAAFSSDGSAIRYTSSFVVDVIFSHKETNGQESKMTHMFCPVRLVPAPVTFCRILPGCGTGGEV